jgi:hypothetical protein
MGVVKTILGAEKAEKENIDHQVKQRSISIGRDWWQTRVDGTHDSRWAEL